MVLSPRINTGLKSFEGNGLGLAAAKKRIEMVYPQRHTLQYGPDNGFYIVQLEIKTDEDNHN
jgi:hypothetical protein